MKILLVMPEFQTHKRFYRKAKWHFPFSIWYIGSYLKRKGYAVVLRDFNISDDNRTYSGYDMVGISCITSQVPRVREIVKDIREQNPTARIAIGGIHPTLFPKQTARYGEFESVVTGDAVPFRETSPLDFSLLDRAMLRGEKQFLGLTTSKGCPYKCTFCVNSILPNSFQWWTAEQLIYEVDRGLSMGFKGMFFWDDNFFALRKRAMKFMDWIEKNNIKMPWFAFTRANQVSSKLFKRAYDCGLRRVSLGAESGSDRVLRKLRKGITSQETLQAAHILEDIGIEASYSYMIGLPGETPEDIVKTTLHMSSLGNIQKYPKIVGPMLYCPYPGSELYNECLELGWKEPKRFEDWTDETSGIAERPWIKNKDLTNIYWFYSFLIPLPYKKILNVFTLYVRRTKKLGLLLLTPGILLLATFGKLRHKLKWYRFPFEVYLLKPLRGVIGS